MLSIKRSPNKVWRGEFWKLLPGGYDNNKQEVHQAFIDGMTWADENRVPHKRTDPRYYSDQYLRTLRDGDPIIPEFMRWYCVHRNGLHVVEMRSAPQPSATSAPVSASRRRPTMSCGRPPFINLART